ncbi:hypothetical protein MMC18_003282 [Xylographa bjoerkii]|nr:hypothetical protein [Xylographa bjoerkii]
MADNSDAHEPLIADEADIDANSRNLQSICGTRAAADQNQRLTGFIWALTVTAGISGLLFGYDTGVISSTLVSIGSDLSQRPLTTLDKSLITSSTSLFALIASPITGVLADRLGRKRIIIIADVLFVFGAVWQAIAERVWSMILGRSIIGLAVGGASLVVPLYISELSPSAFRGRLVTLSILFITVGQMAAYVVGWKLSSTVHGWRWMVGLGSVPAIIQSGLILLLPETPRWLMKAGQVDIARKILKRVYGAGSNTVVEALLRSIEKEILEEEEFKDVSRAQGSPAKGNIYRFQKLRDTRRQLFNIGGNRRALTIACLLQGLQQLCGFNSLMYFSATIFSLVGFDSPTLASLSVAVTNCIFTVLAILLIDIIGRRRILLYSIPIMVLGLLLTAVSFYFLPAVAQKTDDFTYSTSHIGVWPWLILFFVIVYVASYALGLGNVPWQQSELFPLSVRAMGSGIATSTNWGTNFVVGLTFLPMMQAMTPVWTFVTYAIVCVVGWFCIWKIYPETRGLGLEEVGELLKDGWGVGGSPTAILRET